MSEQSAYSIDTTPGGDRVVSFRHIKRSEFTKMHLILWPTILILAPAGCMFGISQSGPKSDNFSVLILVAIVVVALYWYGISRAKHQTDARIVLGDNTLTTWDGRVLDKSAIVAIDCIGNQKASAIKINYKGTEVLPAENLKPALAQALHPILLQWLRA